MQQWPKVVSVVAPYDRARWHGWRFRRDYSRRFLKASACNWMPTFLIGEFVVTGSAVRRSALDSAAEVWDERLIAAPASASISAARTSSSTAPKSQRENNDTGPTAHHQRRVLHRLMTASPASAHSISF